MPLSGCAPISDPASPCSSHTDLFGDSSRPTTPCSSSFEAKEQPQCQKQGLEIDLSFNNMDLVPYISVEGEYKEWDRNDPDDYEAAEEFKLCGSEKEREDALEAWKAAYELERTKIVAEAQMAAEKEENDWYLEMTGMSALEWKANDAKQKAANDHRPTALSISTSASTTKASAPHMESHPSTADLIVPSIETPVHNAHITAPVSEIGEQDCDLEAELWQALEADGENDGDSLDWGSPEPPIDLDSNKGVDAHITAPALEVGEEDDGLEAELWAALEAGDKEDSDLLDWGSPEPPSDLNSNEGVTVLDKKVRDCDDDGAALSWGSPEPPVDTNILNNTPTGASVPQPAKEDSMSAKELFNPKRKEVINREKRRAKKTAKSSNSARRTFAASTHSSKTVKPKKKTQAPDSTVQNAGAITDTSVKTAKPKRSYKARAKKADQAPACAIETPAPEAQLTAPAVDIDEEDSGLEAELWAALEAEMEEDGGAPCRDEANTSSAISTLASNVPSNSTANGYTSGLVTDLPPGADNETDTESDLGSDMSPEEWAAINGESPASSGMTDGRRASRTPLTTIGTERVAKRELKKRKAVIRALRYETLHQQRTNSLHQAIVHIHSKTPEKAREIFIDNRLSDLVIHGRQEADDMIMMDQNSVLPKLYHRYWKDGPNYRLLAKHMDLQPDVKLNKVYVSLGLDVFRGKDIFAKIQKLLKNPGCSLRIDGDLVDEHKITIGERAHQLLAIVGWGDEHFQRPALSGRENKDKLYDKVCWSSASTEIFLGFSKLLYKAAKMDEARRKGLNRRVHHMEPTVPEPAEPQVSLPSRAVPAVPAPVAPAFTAKGSAAPSPPGHALPSPSKRPYAVIDLTSDIEEEVVVSPAKRVRFFAQQQTQQIQNSQLPLHPSTAHHQARVQVQVLAPRIQTQQCAPATPPYQSPQHVRAQNDPEVIQQMYQSRQVLPQYQSPPRPHAVAQVHSPQRPWSHLQTKHNSPQRHQLRLGQTPSPGRQQQQQWQQQRQQQTTLRQTFPARGQQFQMQQRSQVQNHPQNLVRPQHPQGQGV